VQLADGGALLPAMGHAIDHLRAHAANTLATVVIEDDRLRAGEYQIFVDAVQHLQE